MREASLSQVARYGAGELQSGSCAVLVMSCDAYQDLWTPFFTLFWRHWPDCPFAVYLGTNHLSFDHPRVTSLREGDHEWSLRLRTYLNRIQANYILLLLEDYFFTTRISTADVERCLHSLHRLKGIVLRLYPRPGPDQPLTGDAAIGRIERNALYRVSTQAAIWNKASLLELLKDDESIWDFERKGTGRSQASPDGFYSTYNAVMSYERVIERGQWFPSAARYFERQQIGCDFNSRRVMSWATEIRKAITGNSKTLLGWLLPRKLGSRI